MKDFYCGYWFKYAVYEDCKTCKIYECIHSSLYYKDYRRTNEQMKEIEKKYKINKK